jgi:REP element-mobilizing transposase RayT
MNNLRFRDFYRRRLPHIQVPGATYFITFRLVNSLPTTVFENLMAESQKIKSLSSEQASLAHQDWFARYDDFLDRTVHGECFLKNEPIADMVYDSIRFRDGKIFDLIAFTIMPNHVHIILKPLEKVEGTFYSLTEILHSLKRHAARQANLLLNRTGAFWQHESYDHVIRDETELERTVKYILHNPVKAGLVDDRIKWQWSYCKYEVW